jgi:hypothetical protein
MLACGLSSPWSGTTALDTNKADVTDPFKIDGPACISFSGGRTSAYMLRRIQLAHGGTLPADVTCRRYTTGRLQLP